MRLFHSPCASHPSGRGSKWSALSERAGSKIRARPPTPVVHRIRSSTTALIAALVIGQCALVIPVQLRAAQLDLTTATIVDLQAAMQSGALSSEKITQRYLARIAAYDQQGPTLNTVITLNPRALDEARALDAERKAGKIRSAIHGVPIVLKDNIDTFDLPTTAGSQVLIGSIAPDDAFVTKRLRAAGAVIIAKVNLSEFAAGGGSVSGARDPAILKAGTVPNGSSTAGGQTRNPHDLTRGPAGSSGGTGAAIAAAFAQFGLGTDTAGSVRGPAAANGIVGLKTTLGLVSRDGVVPLALSFDTVGPMARTVTDTAAALNILAATDPDDTSTRESSAKRPADYTTFLKRGSLRGARIGVARDLFGQDAETDRIINDAIATLKKLGATIIDPIEFPSHVQATRQPIFTLVRNSEFKAQIADYLKTLKPGFPRTLEEIIAKTDDPTFGYRSKEKAFALKYTNSQALPLDDPLYLAAVNDGVAMVKAGVAAVFAKHQLDAIVYPAAPRPASPIEPGGGAAGISPATLANESGFPDLVVPAGMTQDGLPVAISFLGRAYSEPQLLGYGYDFEQATKALRLPKTTPALPTDTITY
jgi:amidase